MAARFDSLAPGTPVTACPIISLRNSRGISGQGEFESFDNFVEADDPVSVGLISVDLASDFGKGDSYRSGVKYWHGFFMVIGQKADQILEDGRMASRSIGIRVLSSSSSISTMAALPFPLSCLDWTFFFVFSFSYSRYRSMY